MDNGVPRLPSCLCFKSLSPVRCEHAEHASGVFSAYAYAPDGPCLCLQCAHTHSLYEVANGFAYSIKQRGEQVTMVSEFESCRWPLGRAAVAS